MANSIKGLNLNWLSGGVRAKEVHSAKVCAGLSQRRWQLWPASFASEAEQELQDLPDPVGKDLFCKGRTHHPFTDLGQGRVGVDGPGQPGKFDFAV